MSPEPKNQLVSVIIPIFRRPDHLTEALHSVLSQSYEPMEVIVVDDASGDEWVRQYDIPPGVTLLRLAQNLGPGAARNAGLAASRGSLIAWLDSDDIWLPDYLEAQVGVLEANPEAGLVYCHTTMVDETLQIRAEQLEPLAIRDNPLPIIVKKNLIRSPSCVVARRTVVTQAGGYDESLKGAEDWDLWISMARFAPYAYDPTARVLYRVHAAQRSTFGLHRLAVDEDTRVKWLRWAEREAPQLLPVIRKALSRDLQRNSSLYLQHGRDFPKAIRTSIWAIKTYPKDIRNYSRFLRVLFMPLTGAYRNGGDSQHRPGTT